MKIIRKLVIISVIMLGIIFALKYASNFEKKEVTNKINLVVNYTNVTAKMKNDVYIENGIIYLSKEDIKNYYDEYIYYDKDYNRIITTYKDKIAYISVDNGDISINDSKIINAKAITKNNVIYIPISKLEEVYNIKITYLKDKNVLIIESLDRESKIGLANRKMSVKYKATWFSKDVDKLDLDEVVTIIPTEGDLKGWMKVRTVRGKIGYVQEKDIKNIRIAREKTVDKKQIEGKISICWEYFSEFAHAPERTNETLQGVNVVSPAFFYIKDGALVENVGTQGEQYIMWAHNNNYKIWPMVANNIDSADKKEAFSKIMNDSKLRLELINNIVDYAEKYSLDGINLDFENMYQKDQDMFSRFVIELAPRLKAMNVVLSVDVTAPDGSPDWSLCFDRNVIGTVSDYVVFMAYDQNGTSSKSAGSVAGYDWVELGITKFLKQEEISAEKIILGIPFYTRLWKEKGTNLSSTVVSMKNVQKNIPNGINSEWDEITKQNFVQYDKSGTTYKIWIEDEKSITEKLNLIKQYNLAGAGFWVKGFEMDSVWKIIDEKLGI